MKVKSLYQFYKKYFDIPDSHNVAYARAIVEFMDIIRKVYKEKSCISIQEYKESKYRRKFTLGFLDNFEKLVNKNYEEHFSEISYYNSKILIPKRELKDRRIKDGLFIPIEFLIDIENREFTIVTFTPKYQMNREIAVIKGLFDNFYVKGILPAGIEKVTYWELSKGREKSIIYSDMKSASKESLIIAADKYIEGEKRKKKSK